ncbi:uncharacterized protein CDAR_530591 [Caerostris darwini]|uniref:Secreted protein n=1 Tax=Caerostris darwini TaxID=1538125 RepID=A0AAV4QSS0_9ARAC|nr:uncharacterized protein CDAR_530591 [Caerostris darwini]
MYQAWTQCVIFLRKEVDFVCVGSMLEECLRVVCDDEFDPIVQDALNFYNTTCTEGTALNALYKKHRACLYDRSSFTDIQMCLVPLHTELDRLGTPPMKKNRTFEENILRIECKYRDNLNECIDYKINTTCGEEALLFRQRLTAAQNRLLKKACEEIGPQKKMDTDEMNHNFVRDNDLPSNPHKYTTFEPDEIFTAFNVRNTSTSVITLPPKLVFTLLIIMLLKWSH